MLKSCVKYVSAISLFIALSALAAASQERSDRLSPMDIFNIQYASQPQISPDGTKIVYTRNFGNVATDKNYSNLWIINFDGSDNRPLTTGNHDDSSAQWSPDGTRIMYVSDRDGQPQIYVRWMDNGQTAKITNLQFPPTAADWSPDGKSIAFVSMIPKAGPRIGSVPSAPAGANWAPPAKIYNTLVYRFNGIGYLPYASNQLFVVSADGGSPRQLTSGDHPLGGIGDFASPDPQWTPDGKYILVSANRRDDYEYNPQDTEIYQLSVEDGAIKALTDRRGPDDSPSISPDGKYIAYTGYDDRFQGYQNTYLYIMNRDGSGAHAVSTKLDRSVTAPLGLPGSGRPQWAADGSGVYVIYDNEGDTRLGFFTLDGTLKKICDHLGSLGLAYSFGASFSVARNGNFVISYTTPTEPGDIAVGNVRSGSTRMITNVNEGLLAQKKIGQTEEIWYSSSVDKRKIQGWIIKPPDFDPSRKYPLILEIHGGPFADYGDRFDMEKQIMAAQGYVVLYTNPRGSTSYGEEFGNLIHHNYPSDDFYDLNSGVDAVIAKGYIDTDNIFVTGGSGGGVLTCWMVDRSTRFRAAACLYPVINWYSWTLDSDIPIVGAKYWFPGNPWENTEQFMKRSVISLVGKVTTPTMLMVGEEDWRCPPEEAEQFYTALKLRKVDTALVLVPGEPHGISRIPSHHMQKMAYILNWFDEHRKRE